MFLKKRNISSKIKRSKVTDYAALNQVNQLRYDSVVHKYQGKSSQVLNAFDGWIALVFLILAEYHYWKRMFQEPFIRHLYQFLNVPSHEWHS